MSLSAAFNVISSSFAVNSAQTAVVSNNIANANTPGYSREIANVVTNSYGGADVASVTREANAALLEQVSSSTSQAATQQAISDGLSTLAQTVDDSASASSTSGANQNGASPSAMLANLQSALSTYGASPTSSSAAQAAVSAASALASSLNSGSATVAQVRERADQNMATSVGTINSLLSQFTAANNAVVTGLQTGANVASAEDTRDSIVTQLSQQIGVSTVTAANGSESIYTDSGVTLFQDTPRARLLHSDPDARRRRERRAGHGRWRADHRGQFADADPIGRARRLRGFAGHPRARISGPARPDRRRPHQRLRRKRSVGDAHAAVAAWPVHNGGSDQPALDVGDDRPRRCDRGQSERRPVAGRQSESPARRRRLRPWKPGLHVQPDRLGELIPDASRSSPAEISATQSFDPSAGLGSSSSLADYANASVSWLQGENQQASNASSYQNALATQATGALSNATGVNLDAEMTNMLNLENSYASSAKLLATVTSMFSALLQAA